MGEDDTRVYQKKDADSLGTGNEAAQPPLIPGFTISSQIGQGGMAAVYLGEDVGFTPPRRVAIKLMDSSLSRDPEFRARFEREAAMVASFRHDNIVHIYASGDVQGTKYIVMEFLPGGTLAQKLEQGPLEQRAALQIGARLADALAYSHACHIIHRDFKPGNVLFTAEGKPVLSDFGVAKSALPSDANLTRYASVIGAPRYMAPEQDRGEEVTDRADVFSFALTLFEMFAGKLPSGRLRVGPAATDLKGALPALPALVELIARGLAAEPSQRPSAREIERVLTNLDAASETISRPSSRIPGAERPGQNRAVWVALLTLLCAGAAVGGYVLLGRSHREVPAISTERGGVPATVQVTLVRYPDSTRVRIDDHEISGSVVELRPGQYELVALATGYYGLVQPLQVVAGRTDPIEIRLEPVSPPSGAEFERFLDLDEEISKLNSPAGSAQVEAAAARITQETNELSDRTLQTALRVRLFHATGAISEAEALEQRTATLSRLGDARAAATSVLIAAANKGRLTSDMVTPELSRASQEGDPFASFLVALALRVEEASANGGATRSRTHRSYCSQLQKAVKQGWQGLPAQNLKDCRA